MRVLVVFQLASFIRVNVHSSNGDHHKSSQTLLVYNGVRDTSTKWTPNEEGKFKGKLTFLLLDLKTSGIHQQRKYSAGIDIARKLTRHLWRNVSPENALDVLLHVNSLNDGVIFEGVLDTIGALPDAESWKKRIGFEIGGMESLSKIGETYDRLGISQNRWQGSGNTNCLAYLDGRYSRLQNIVACRDGQSSHCHHVDKGYAWTLDKESSIAREIRLGLDAVITNYPRNALAAMKWNDVAPLVRLAGRQDSPWTRVIRDR
ncbi:dermonecrotic toxin SPH-like isoform X3 [Haemaphysalis longicornis]